MLEQAATGFRIEQIGVVFERKAEAFWMINDIQAEVELCGAVVDGEGSAS